MPDDSDRARGRASLLQEVAQTLSMGSSIFGSVKDGSREFSRVGSLVSPQASRHERDEVKMFSRSLSMRTTRDREPEVMRRARMGAMTWAPPTLGTDGSEKIPIVYFGYDLGCDSEFLGRVRQEAVDLECIKDLEMRTGVAAAQLFDIIEPFAKLCWRMAGEMGQAGDWAQELVVVKSEVAFLRSQLKACNSSAMREISNLRARLEGLNVEEPSVDELNVQFHDPMQFLDENSRKLVLDIIKDKEREWARALRGPSTEADSQSQAIEESIMSDHDGDDESDDGSFFPNCSRSSSKTAASPDCSPTFRRLRIRKKLPQPNEAVADVRVESVRRSSALSGNPAAAHAAAEGTAGPKATGSSAGVGQEGARDSRTTTPKSPRAADARKESGGGGEAAEDGSAGARCRSTAPGAGAAVASGGGEGAGKRAGSKGGAQDKRKSMTRSGSKRLTRKSTLTLERDASKAEGGPRKAAGRAHAKSQDSTCTLEDKSCGTSVATQTPGGEMLFILEAENNRLRLALEEMRIKLRDFLGSCDDKGIGAMVAKSLEEVGMTELFKTHRVFERLYEDAMMRPARMEELLQRHLRKTCTEYEADGRPKAGVPVVEEYCAEYPLRLWPRGVKEDDVPGQAYESEGRRHGSKESRLCREDSHHSGPRLAPSSGVPDGPPTSRGPVAGSRMAVSGNRPSSSTLRGAAAFTTVQKAEPELSPVKRSRSNVAAVAANADCPKPTESDNAPVKRSHSSHCLTGPPALEEARQVASFLQQRRRLHTSPSLEDLCPSSHPRPPPQDCIPKSPGRPAEAQSPGIPSGHSRAPAAPAAKGALANPTLRSILGLSTAHPQTVCAVPDNSVFKRWPKPHLSLPALR